MVGESDGTAAEVKDDDVPSSALGSSGLDSDCGNAFHLKHGILLKLEEIATLKKEEKKTDGKRKLRL